MTVLLNRVRSARQSIRILTEKRLFYLKPTLKGRFIFFGFSDNINSSINNVYGTASDSPTHKRMKKEKKTMKKQKCVVWLLALMLVLGLLLPVCQGMATNPLFGAPKYFIPPKISNPPKIIIPSRIDIPRDIFTDPPEDDLTLTVDKTEATIGDILTFTAVWNNPPRGTSVFLWIFRDDECIQELPENADNRWEYKVESPGIYKGVAVGRFPILDDDLIKEDLHKESPLINVMETISVSTEEQYVMKGGSSVSDYEIELIGLRDIIFLEGGPAPPSPKFEF